EDKRRAVVGAVQLAVAGRLRLVHRDRRIPGVTGLAGGRRQGDCLDQRAAGGVFVEVEGRHAIIGRGQVAGAQDDKVAWGEGRQQLALLQDFTLQLRGTARRALLWKRFRTAVGAEESPQHGDRLQVREGSAPVGATRVHVARNYRDKKDWYGAESVGTSPTRNFRHPLAEGGEATQSDEGRFIAGEDVGLMRPG